MKFAFKEDDYEQLKRAVTVVRRRKEVVKRGLVRVKWYCGCYVREPKWQSGGNDWVYEADECTGEFETEELLEDFEEGDCVVKCVECGAELSQSDGHCERI